MRNHPLFLFLLLSLEKKEYQDYEDKACQIYKKTAV